MALACILSPHGVIAMHMACRRRVIPSDEWVTFQCPRVDCLAQSLAPRRQA